MQKIVFKSDAANKLYSNYLGRVNKTTKILSSNDREDIVMEINSHIHERMVNSGDDKESEVLIDVLDKLGNPEEYLKEMVADKKSEQAIKTLNPKHVLQSIMLNLGKGLGHIFVGILYLVTICFLILIPFEIFDPDRTGLFYRNGEWAGFGYFRDVSGLNEVMGWWLLPSLILIVPLLYFTIIQLLKWLTPK